MTQTIQSSVALDLVAHAFQDQASAAFQKNAHALQFFQAILAHHSYGENLKTNSIEAKASQLINLLFYHLGNRNYETAAGLFSSECLFPEFREAYQNFINFRHPKKRQTFLSPYFYGQSLAFIGKEDLLLKHLTADSRPRFSTMTALLTTGDLKCHDSALLSSRLHNMKAPEKELAKINACGFKRLFIEEEVLLDGEDKKLPLPGINEIHQAAMQSSLMKTYLQMDKSQQLNVCCIAEFIEDLCLRKNPDFMGNFNTISHWVKLFVKTGWHVDRIKIFGFANDEFKPACKALFILGSTTTGSVP